MSAAPAELAVVFEDDWILVVDKPSGMTVHAAAGSPGNDLLALARRDRPSVTLLHRLDREASGLVVLGKNRAAKAPLQRQLEGHQILRVYTAILAGRLPPGEHLVDRPIGERSLGHAAIRRPPPPDAVPARSHFTVIGELGRRATHVEVRLETGRKHQIRIHAASIGHPIFGDRRYGGPPAPRLALHAMRLGFRHPRDGGALELEAPLPSDLVRLMADLCGRPGDVV